MSLGLGLALPMMPRGDLLTAAIRALFANNEQGAWYDPSDLSTMYQDAAGTVPVTGVEQPVGLMLDKRMGLVRGAEVLPNPGNPFTSLTEWGSQSDTATLALVNGAIVATRTTNASAWMIQDTGILLTAGKWYEIVVDMASPDGRNTYVNLFDLTATASLATSRNVATATRTTVSFIVRANNTGNHLLNVGQTAADPVGTRAVLYSASIRELPGNHASQPTTTARPTLKQDAGGRYYLAFDGVDDGMAFLTGSAYTSGGTVAVAAMHTNLSVTGYMLNNVNGGANSGFGLSGSTSNRTSAASGTGSGFNFVSTGGAVDVPHVALASVDGATLRARQNGGAADSTANAANFGGTGWAIGRRADAGSYLTGRIYGALTVSRLLTAAEETGVIRYLASKSGVTL